MTNSLQKAEKSNFKRYAFLIIAHTEPELFHILINQIDNIENDIYIMVDSKVDIIPFKNITTKYSNVYFCDKRVNIKWGEMSQIDAELELFRYASTNSIYDYYHLISGQDLLIKPISKLNEFIKSHSGHEFLRLGNTAQGKQIAQLRLKHYHIIPPHFSRSRNIFIRSLYWIPILLQKLLGIKRHVSGTENLFISSNWCSISHSFVKMILKEEQNIRKTFRFSVAMDEMYKPFVAIKHNILHKCDIEENEHADILRKIDWNRGNPYIWTINDLSELISSTKFIARKFSIKDRQLIEAIYSYTNDDDCIPNKELKV